MNTKLFEKVRKSTDDGRLEMRGWEFRREEACGTTRCMAGWAIYHTTGEELYQWTLDGSTKRHAPSVTRLAEELGVPDGFEEIGGELLGLTPDEAGTAFYMDDDYAARFIALAAEGREEAARQVLVDWEGQ
jgi:hypothetical protein